FRVLRDHPDELRRALELTPYSREEYVRCLGPLDGLDDVERARRLIVRYRQTFGGRGQQATPGQWSYAVAASSRGMADTVSKWLSMIDAVLPAVVERFRRVQIENLPWQEIIRRYDTPETLFYCDPPYLLSTRNGHVGYKYEMTVEEHREVAEARKDRSEQRRARKTLIYGDPPYLQSDSNGHVGYEYGRMVEQHRDENLPWQEIIRRYDTPETLFYCDPPYLLSTRNGHVGYKYEMTVEEHRELAEALNSVKGHVVLSGYASPEYDEWYRDWKRVEFDATMFARPVRQGSRDKRTEVLWIKPAA